MRGITAISGLALGTSLGVGMMTGLSGCATTQYAPQVVARGELTMRYDGHVEMWAGGQKVASGLGYGGLESYVRCVPAAAEQAHQAASSGRKAIAFSVLGGVLGASGLIGLVGLVDRDNWGLWVGGGLGLAAIGLGFSIGSWRAKNHANGHALDALNYYNDSVGSLGATCSDLRYPPPAGEAPAGAGAPQAAPPAPGSLPPPPTVSDTTAPTAL